MSDLLKVSTTDLNTGIVFSVVPQARCLCIAKPLEHCLKGFGVIFEFIDVPSGIQED